MKRSQFRMLVALGTVIEAVVVVMLVMRLHHLPTFPVLIGAWGFIAGVVISKYKEIKNG